jgi:uncharacterized protein (DUF1800 family)
MSIRPRASASFLCALLAACGGGGGGGGDGGTPPIGLSYATPQPTYEAEVAIAPNVPTVGGGAVDSWSVSPPLPSGLSLDASTGWITGTPADASPSASYVVAASNESGQATTLLSIEVLPAAADSLAPKASFDDSDVRHLLMRTHFGITDAHLEAATTMGVPAYVDAMLVFPPTSDVETAADALLLNPEDPPGLEGGFPSHAQLSQWWLFLMTRSTTPFQERLALFWHDHFAASTEVLEGGQTHWGKTHVNLWRKKGNGNLRALLVDMSRDWMMLQWLNGLQSNRIAPNENFAREFFELFTLGVDNGYTQADILEAARAFTGYRSRFDVGTGQSFVEFDTNRHDGNSKTIFGVTIPGQNRTDDYQAVVDVTVDHRPVAEHVSRKLFEHFCHESPKPGTVDQMAAILRGADYELVPLLAALFKSEAFYSAKSKAGLVKGPVDHNVGFIRATGLVIRVGALDAALSIEGQRPTQPPTVNGWPVGTEWLSAQGMLDRANVVLTCIADRTRQANGGVDVSDLLPPGTPTSGEVVDALAARLRVTLSASERAACVTYLDTQRLSDGTVVSSPFDPNNPTHVDERVRGLLYVLAQHPTYQIR